jgi:hypothetical protein
MIRIQDAESKNAGMPDCNLSNYLYQYRCPFCLVIVMMFMLKGFAEIPNFIIYLAMYRYQHR